MMSTPRVSSLVMPALFGFALILSLVRVTATTSHEYFVERPHLVEAGEAGPTAVKWLSPDDEASWLVRYRTAAAGRWQQVSANLIRRVAGEEMRTRRLYEAVLEHVAPGESCQLEVLRNGIRTFEATVAAPSTQSVTSAN